MGETVINPVDVYFKKVTHYHIYFIAIYFATKFMSVWHTLNIIFLSPPMTYTCASGEPANETKIKYNVCPCDNPVWDYSIFTKTLQTKFGIICDQVWIIRLSESISFFGLLVGALVFGFLCDRFGRLQMYSLCQFIIGFSGCLVSVAPNMVAFCFLRFFEGMGSGGAIVTGYVLSAEFCGVGYRPSVSSSLHIASNFGLIALAGISYLFRNCDHFQLAVSIPVLIFSSIRFILMESPKWLLDKNKKEEAIKVMERVCRFNKKPYDTVRPDVEAYLASRTGSNIKTMKFYHIFKFRTHSKNFGLMSYMYFVCGMSYYGVSQFIGKMSQHVHKNTAINGALLSIGTFATILLVHRIGRRPFLRTTMLFAGIFMLTVAFMPDPFNPPWVRTMVASFSSSFFYSSFIIVYLFGVELFPTNIRSSTLGVLSLVARIGQIIGPQINSLSHRASAITFGSSAIIGCVITFFLPETRGVELPSTLESIPRVSFSDKVTVRSVDAPAKTSQKNK